MCSDTFWFNIIFSNVSCWKSWDIYFKKRFFGGGDIKLTFVLGFILGIKAGIVALVLSSFLALPYAIATLYLKDNHEFAYGPFIAGALFIVFFHLDKFNMLIDYVFIL